MCGEQNPRHPLDGILDGLADSIADEVPAELLDEARAAGRNSETVARDVRSVLQAALKRFEQRKLDAAREAYRQHAEARSGRDERIALSPEERKRQLSAILQSNPEIGAVLTTQHREFETLSDEDVESALEDLAELGFLDDSPGASRDD
jgi:hypothetical protein